MSVDSMSQYTYDLSTGPGIGLQGPCMTQLLALLPRFLQP